jgi:hypothetical protein
LEASRKNKDPTYRCSNNKCEAGREKIIPMIEAVKRDGCDYCPGKLEEIVNEEELSR